MTREEGEVSVICRSCGSELKHKHASKCHVCQSDQTWKRHLGFSSTFLALLIALASVATASWEKIAPYFLDEIVFVDVIDVENSTLNMVAINNTLNTVWLKSATLIISDGSPKKGIPFNLEVGDNQRFIAKGEPTFISAKLEITKSLIATEYYNHELPEFGKEAQDHIMFLFDDDEIKNAKCIIELSYTSGSEPKEKIRINISDIKVTLDGFQAGDMIWEVSKILRTSPENLDLHEKYVISSVDNLCVKMIIETHISALSHVSKKLGEKHNKSN
jgi:hypothetical protein